MSLKLVDY